MQFIRVFKSLPRDKFISNKFCTSSYQLAEVSVEPKVKSSTTLTRPPQSAKSNASPVKNLGNFKPRDQQPDSGVTIEHYPVLF